MVITSQQLALAFLARCAGAFAVLAFAPELLDLRPRSIAKALVQRVAGFDLPRVDQQGPGAGETSALIIVNSKQLEIASMERRAFAVLRIATFEAGYPFEHQLGDRGVLATTMNTGGTPISARSQRLNSPS